jgi:hypothetical protein
MWRVVQWTTGRTGAAAVRAMVKQPVFEIVGCFAWSADKAGRDVGELCGIDPIGVLATHDIDALLALKPDCVTYMPYRSDIDHVVRILEAGINVVTTMYMLSGRGYGQDAEERIAAAAERGGSSLYSSGIYPGHVPMVALATSAMCSRIDCISMLESVDMRGYRNEKVFRSMGIDMSPDDPNASTTVEGICGSFRDQVRAMALALAVELDDVRFSAEFAVADEDLDFGYMTVRRGHIAAIKGTIAGIVDGESRIECRSVWKMGADRMTPNWPVENGYVVEIEGTPSVRVQLGPLNPGDRHFNGDTNTAVPVVNSIPMVCAAPPGIVNKMELPFVRGAHTIY